MGSSVRIVASDVIAVDVRPGPACEASAALLPSRDIAGTPVLPKAASPGELGIRVVL